MTLSCIQWFKEALLEVYGRREYQRGRWWGAYNAPSASGEANLECAAARRQQERYLDADLELARMMREAVRTR